MNETLLIIAGTLAYLVVGILVITVMDLTGTYVEEEDPVGARAAGVVLWPLVVAVVAVFGVGIFLGKAPTRLAEKLRNRRNHREDL